MDGPRRVWLAGSSRYRDAAHEGVRRQEFVTRNWVVTAQQAQDYRRPRTGRGSSSEMPDRSDAARASSCLPYHDLRATPRAAPGTIPKMRMVTLDGFGTQDPLVGSCALTKHLRHPMTNVSRRHRIPVFRHPGRGVRAVPDPERSLIPWNRKAPLDLCFLRIFTTRTGASFAGKRSRGCRARDPASTLDRLAIGATRRYCGFPDSDFHPVSRVRRIPLPGPVSHRSKMLDEGHLQAYRRSAHRWSRS